jgi:membrane protein implicated in regulation of membrane protease activity
MTPDERPDRPPTNEELAVALAVNAALKPLNIIVVLVVVVVALVLGAPLALVVVAAVVLYTAAVARTMFDRAETERVTEKQHRHRQE